MSAGAGWARLSLARGEVYNTQVRDPQLNGGYMVISTVMRTECVCKHVPDTPRVDGALVRG